MTQNFLETFNVFNELESGEVDGNARGKITV